MEFDRYGMVKCSKIEQMLPKLMKMVEGEMESEINSMGKLERAGTTRNGCDGIAAYEDRKI